MCSVISIHAPREGGDEATQKGLTSAYISIHAPREGGDDTNGGFIAIHMLFQSTPPVRGATFLGHLQSAGTEISIHAPREGGDIQKPDNMRLAGISIHAPREGGDSS